VAIENTHVRSGGRAWRLEEIDALVGITAPVGVALHCDGARIWNASVATGIGLEEYGRRFATLSVCLSKGLGAPVGSLIVSSAENARRARFLRRQLGGAMRQSGILAAGGLHALHHHLDRLADDHRRAKTLAEALGEAAPGRIQADRVETNVVLFGVTEADRFIADAAERGVLVGAISPTVVRAVTHLDITDEQIRSASEVLGALLEADASRPYGAARRTA
jgi:threonine aldolase